MPYIQNATTFVIETVLGLYLIVVILRFLFQLLRVEFRNQISQLVVTLTNPPLKFLRRFIPGLFGIDLASVVLMFIVSLVKIILLLSVSDISFNFIGSVAIALAEIINTIIWILIIAILASAVMSWVSPGSRHPVARLIDDMSRPVLKPFRKITPSFQNIDISPIFALLVLNLALRLVSDPLSDFGQSLLRHGF